VKYRIAAWALFMSNYEDKNLEELEGLKGGAPSFDSSVVTNCHRLLKVPIGKTLTDPN
jgi:hypothetical protein